MKKIPTVLAIASISVFLSGCLWHSRAQTTYLVSLSTAQVPPPHVEQTIDQIVQQVAEGHGLALAEKRFFEDQRLRDKSYVRVAEHGPQLWVIVHFGQSPIRVDVEERHASHPSRQHYQLRNDLKKQFDKAGLRAIEVTD